ncbi:hypothetical protein [Clostridium felsineum]|uniref:Uncharacterized protein n=1 Tax=Clostridium felsineum TaxID=36839 RepID=A0A1S8LEY2_9CLOT|nr:hypothetical protein [Clostridium felsineum]URZ07420.1 hypothetical protein CLROS_027580 [Clostridium felsineum]URZ12451.1 hypothetical protein CROST_031730 [Clostridium felsineum]
MTNPTKSKKEKVKKKQKLRNNEYYNLQDEFDKLYENGLRNYKFRNLMDIITKENNILLAYRNIKRNKGSKTVGTDKQNILKIAEENPYKCQLKNVTF